MSDLRFVIKIDPPTPRLEVFRDLLHAVERERFEAGEAACTWPPSINGQIGCPIIDFDLLEHIDRIYMPRIERLKRLVEEEEARVRMERRIAGMRTWP